MGRMATGILVGVSALAIVGWVLTFTVAPGAINMAVGATIIMLIVMCVEAADAIRSRRQNR